jgi:hypothetical protein
MHGMARSIGVKITPESGLNPRSLQITVPTNITREGNRERTALARAPDDCCDRKFCPGARFRRYNMSAMDSLADSSAIRDSKRILVCVL